jgi:hypothetical protein
VTTALRELPAAGRAELHSQEIQIEGGLLGPEALAAEEAQLLSDRPSGS